MPPPKEYLVEILLTRFEKNFAPKMAAEIVNQNLQEALVVVLKDSILFELKNPIFQSDTYNYLRAKKKPEREQIAFRSAYLFETLYFKDKNMLQFLKNDFVDMFSAISNESMKRHFGKILTDILKNNLLKFSEEDCVRLAQTATNWAVAPQTRVAVQIWAFEILILLKEKANIDTDTISYLLEILTQDSTPAIKSRMRKWGKKYKNSPVISY